MSAQQELLPEPADATAAGPQFKDLHPAVRVIAAGSVTAAAVALAVLFALMLAEAAARYVFASPLGWNVSLVERVLMPGAVFLALPWMYACAGHVSAGLVYSRLPSSVRTAARVVTLIAVLGSAIVLLVAGVNGAASAFALGDAPPPGSSDIGLPTWVWLSLQPVGALGLLAVALIDAPRFLRSGEVES